MCNVGFYGVFQKVVDLPLVYRNKILLLILVVQLSTTHLPMLRRIQSFRDRYSMHQQRDYTHSILLRRNGLISFVLLFSDYRHQRRLNLECDGSSPYRLHSLRRPLQGRHLITKHALLILVFQTTRTSNDRTASNRHGSHHAETYGSKVYNGQNTKYTSLHE